MIMTKNYKENFKTAKVCWICKTDLGDDRVRDHCHISGNYRGACHNNCNLQLRINPNNIKIPVVFHNLRGYDGHLIIEAIGKASNKNITCIPNKMEKYI